jgi:hypothetical protein
VKVVVWDSSSETDVCCSGSVVNAFNETVATASGCSSGWGSFSQEIALSVSGAGKLDLQCAVPRWTPGVDPSYISSYRYDNYN